MEGSILEDADSINCGRCGQTFQSFVDFKTHKLSPCHPPVLGDGIHGLSALPPVVPPAPAPPVAGAPPPPASQTLPHQQPVVYFKNAIADRTLLNSILGVVGIGGEQAVTGGVSYPPVEIVASSTDVSSILTSGSQYHYYQQLSMQQQQTRQQQQSQQQQHPQSMQEQPEQEQPQQSQEQPNDIVAFAVNEDYITHLSAFIDVSNGIIASQDLDLMMSSSENRLIAPALTQPSRDQVTVTTATKSRKRAPLDDLITTVGRTTVKAALPPRNLVDGKNARNDDGDLSTSKSPKKPRNKVMSLPAKNPLNLTAKSSSSATEKAGERGRTAGATMTQTQTTRVFKLSCPYCQKLFCKQFDLDAHARVHTGEKPFQCCICGKCFAQKSNVKKHLSTHKVWPDGRVSLPPTRVGNILVNAAGVDTDTASSKFAPSSSARVVDAVENLVSSYYCQFCDDKFPHYAKLSSHLAAVHKDRQVFKCRVLTCPETFAEATDLVAHLGRFHDPAEIKYRCEECGIEFSTLREVGLHHYDHTAFARGGAVEVGGGDVDHDEKITTSAGNQLDSQTKDVKASKKTSLSSARYICTHCGDKFAREEALKVHLKTVSHAFPCQICAIIRDGGVDSDGVISEIVGVFSSERLLRKHMKECHAISKHVCPHCAKSFKTKALLNVHLKIHGPSIYECEDALCRRKFKRQDQLVRHRTTMHGKLRLRCPYKTVCSKRFGRRDQLRLHVKHAHEATADRRPWKCRECGKGFLERHHLVEHESTHGDNRKFRCESCGRGFLRKKQMVKHSCEVGDRWRRRKASGGCGRGHGEKTAWRKSTLLRSGRRTRPPIRPQETALEDLDAAFHPVVTQPEERLDLPPCPEGTILESALAKEAPLCKVALDSLNNGLCDREEFKTFENNAIHNEAHRDYCSQNC